MSARAGHLFIGRLVEKKGITVMAAALRKLRAEGWSEPFSVLGDGPLRAALSGIPGVAMHGWLSPGVVREHLRRAACVWVPSIIASDGDGEGLPSVIAEAMMEGCPVICSDGPGLTFAVADAGIVVPTGDSNALGDAARQLSEDSQRASELSARARQRAFTHFDAMSQSAALEDWFLDLAEQHQHQHQHHVGPAPSKLQPAVPSENDLTKAAEGVGFAAIRRASASS
jgi:glycosyltransferase involved in cell wall biosynthesis